MPIYYNNILRLLLNFKYISIKKIFNIIKLYISYFLSLTGKEKTGFFSPYFFSAEVSNFCNLHCPECPVGIQKFSHFDAVHLNFELYKSLIDQQKTTLQHVILYFQGEPLLNKRLVEYIRYAHQARIYTSTSTNGQFLNKKNAKDLVLSGLDKLIVSIDGATQEIYEKYRVGGQLNKVLEGVEDLVYWKKELKLLTPLIEIQFIVMRENEHQIPDMKFLFKKLKADRLTFKTGQLYDFEDGNERLTTIRKYARYEQTENGKFRIKSSLPNRCMRLWSGAVVNAYGDVLPCCYDKGSEFSFGNLNHTTFDNLWHNNDASGFRDSILRNRKQYEMCRNCTSK